MLPFRPFISVFVFATTSWLLLADSGPPRCEAPAFDRRYSVTGTCGIQSLRIRREDTTTCELRSAGVSYELDARTTSSIVPVEGGVVSPFDGLPGHFHLYGRSASDIAVIRDGGVDAGVDPDTRCEFSDPTQPTRLLCRGNRGSCFADLALVP